MSENEKKSETIFMKSKAQGTSEKLWITTLCTDVIWTRNLYMKFEDYRYIGTAILNFLNRTTDSHSASPYAPI